MTDAPPPDDDGADVDATDEADGGGAPPGEGDVEGILRADPAEGPDATQESWVDDDPARTSGG